jgi:hypothetical protein
MDVVLMASGMKHDVSLIATNLLRTKIAIYPNEQLLVFLIASWRIEDGGKSNRLKASSGVIATKFN